MIGQRPGGDYLSQDVPRRTPDWRTPPGKRDTGESRQRTCRKTKVRFWTSVPGAVTGGLRHSRVFLFGPKRVYFFVVKMKLKNVCLSKVKQKIQNEIQPRFQ